MKKKILLIGAYERDNFGDELFFILTKKYLQKHSVTAGSLISADTRKTIGEVTLSYDYLLRNYHWDLVWVVGGEIGGLDARTALSMSLDGEFRDEYIKAAPETKEKLVKFLTGEDNGQAPAYIPDMSKYKLNANLPLVLNSVGMRLSDNNSMTKARLSIAKVVVRNKTPNVRSAPDLVHTLPYFFKFSCMKSDHRDSYIVFQASAQYLERHGLEEVAEQINQIIRNSGLNVILLAAGTAPHHDSVVFYERLKEVAANDKLLISSHDRNPLSIVRLIANASAWIGTSLHGRIVAEAFKIPRISLENEKVSAYAKDWDAKYPFAVEVGRISKAYEHAYKHDVGDSLLSELADENMKQLIGEYA